MDAMTTLPADGRAFSVCYFAAFAAAWVLLFCEGRRRGWPTGPWLLLVAWTMLCAVAGSKLAMLTPEDWATALGHGLLPTTTHKSFIGIVVGGFIGVRFARRLLGFTATVGDAFALALPMGLAVARVGCLLGGCCFGTPTSLPWAVCYPAGSLAHSVHIARGLIPAWATTSLAVHPVQAYEIVLLAGALGVLLWARSRLKRKLSLFLLYIILQSLVRLGIEFVREGRPVPHVIGLSPLQLALAGLALGCAVALWFRERRRAAEMPDTVRLRPGPAVAFAAGMGAALVIAGGWFTQLELAMLITAALPALVLAARAAAREARPVLRWTATAALAGPLMLVMTQADDFLPVPEEPEEPPQAYCSVTAGGAVGRYTEICGDVYDYTEGGLAVSRTDDLGKAGRLEYGLGGSFDRTDDDIMALARIFARYDHRWAGLGLGGYGGYYVDNYPGGSVLLPSASLRLGPEDIFYLEGALFDQPSGFQPMIRAGIGFLSLERHRATLRLGLSLMSGFYAHPSFAVGKNVVVSPFLAYADRHDYHVGLNFKYSFGHSWDSE